MLGLRKQEKDKEREIQVVDKGAENTPGEPTREEPQVSLLPDVDIYEKDDVIYLLADMPGVKKEDLEITLEKNVLHIEGRSSYTRPEGFGCAYSEFRAGRYRRSFALNDEIDRDKIDAQLKDGVLQLTLRRLVPSKTKIEVR